MRNWRALYLALNFSKKVNISHLLPCDYYYYYYYFSFKNKKAKKQARVHAI